MLTVRAAGLTFMLEILCISFYHPLFLTMSRMNTKQFMKNFEKLMKRKVSLLDRLSGCEKVPFALLWIAVSLES